MRLAFMIISLAAIAITLVSLRGMEVAAQQDLQQMQRRLVVQRRQLWTLDAALAELRSYHAVDIRAEEMGIELLAPGTHDINEELELYDYALSGNMNLETEFYLDGRSSGGGG